jgi:hypothetical protein
MQRECICLYKGQRENRERKITLLDCVKAILSISDGGKLKIPK